MTIIETLRKYYNVNILPLSERIYDLRGSLLSLILALYEDNFLIIARSDDDCMKIRNDYNFYVKLTGGSRLVHIQDSVDPEVSGRQVEMLLETKGDASVVTTHDVCKTPFAGIDELRSDTVSLRRGMEISRNDLTEWIHYFGYKRVSLVVERGEYSLRNYILDMFPANSDYPVRIEFFGDEIDTLRLFSVDSQRTIDNLEEFTLLPLRHSEGDKHLHDLFTFSHIFYSEGEENPSGYICNSAAVTQLSENPIFEGGAASGFLPLAGLGIYPDERSSVNDLPANLKAIIGDTKVFMVAPTHEQAERIKEIFAEGSIIAPVLNPDDVKDFSGNICITTGDLSEGFHIPGLMALTDREIFGETRRYRSMKRSSVSGLLHSIDDLNPGDYVVSDEHGIGVFEGLKKVTTEGFEADMVIVRYANDARLYRPVYYIGGIKKYRAEEGVIPCLDKMGGKSWQKVKKRVREKIRVTAVKLVKLYAERGVKKGHAFSADREAHREFDNFFPYEETPDQLTAIHDIKRDMESDKPMDRLLCGDVGYGKTEVAMRAVFKSLFDGRQAAVLVPTTILCEQHYLTFKERFQAFPFSIDCISRFKSRKEINETLSLFVKGELDVLIGTHGLLRNSLDIPGLGLLVIDEEHRFGVAQKEKIKELKKDVDCLSLSATPIPRTLQMALSGIWNMSSIETPPEERVAVRTFISSFNKEILKEAIERELTRKGQVYFVHNRIGSIDRMHDIVLQLAPSARVAVAHGQMKEKELEEVMIDFINKKIDILVSTAIIGSGIDIPTANTIIVNRADMMGLADLYQLRGRVGRSSIRAFAYFFVPGEDFITDKAKKRLTAVQELSFLGAGLRLAMKDLEIRGAGNLLGPEQSGHIHAVGLDTYLEMLEEEISQLKGVAHEKNREPNIDLKTEALIPEEYIEDISLRLNFYRRIALASGEDEIYNLSDEMTDRFGKLPDSTINLFNIMRLKLTCMKLKVESVYGLKEKAMIHFFENHPFTGESFDMIHELFGIRPQFSEKDIEIPLRTTGEKDFLPLLIDILRSLR